MRILVTGRDGQLVRSLIERAEGQPDVEIVASGRPQLDLERPGSVAEAIRALKPDLVINAAAYTAVDQAEEEPARALRINADAAGEAAAAAAEVGAPIVQISTDYVFDGAAAEPYREDAAPRPLNVYGASKLAGEEQVRVANPQHIILRTSWVYSPFGRNFVRTMLTLAEQRDQLRIVSDQRGCPTSALDLADALLRLARQWASGNREGWGQTYHLAGGGEASWSEFASEIFRVSGTLGGPTAEIQSIGTADFPTPAARPRYSVLDSGQFNEAFGFGLRPWPVATAEVVGRLVSESARG